MVLTCKNLYIKDLFINIVLGLLNSVSYAMPCSGELSCGDYIAGVVGF